MSKKTTVTVRLPDALVKEIDRFARSEPAPMSRSRAVHILLVEAIARKKGGAK